jgi:hypothetical protein
LLCTLTLTPLLSNIQQTIFGALLIVLRTPEIRTLQPWKMIHLVSKFELPTLDWFVHDGTVVYRDGTKLVTIANGLDKEMVGVEGAFVLEHAGPRIIIIRKRDKLVLHRPDSVQEIILPEHNSGQLLTASESHILLRLEKADAGSLLLFNTAGQVRWELKDIQSTSALLSGDSILIRTPDNEIHCLDLADGKIRWKTSPLSAQNGFRNLVQLETDGHRLVVIGDSGVMSINVETGQQTWVRTFAGDLFFTGRYSNNLLIVFSYGTLIQLDVETGKTLKTADLTVSLTKIKFTIPGHTSPAIGQNHILIASNYEPIAVVISLNRFEIESVLQLESSHVPASIAPVFSSDRIFIQDSNKVLYIFQC